MEIQLPSRNLFPYSGMTANLRTILYDLEQSSGLRGEIYFRSEDTFDPAIGEETFTTSQLAVKFIVSQEISTQSHLIDDAGTFKAGDVIVIIRKDLLTKDFEPNKVMYVSLAERFFTIVAYADFFEGIELHLRHTDERKLPKLYTHNDYRNVTMDSVFTVTTNLTWPRVVGPFVIDIESISAAGKPIYRIQHVTGNVICHNGSGDYPGLSNDGTLIGLRDDDFTWHILNLETWEILSTIPEVDETGFVTKHVMWKGNNGFVNGTLDYLPQDVEGQWRSGTGGGRTVQYVVLYKSDGTSVYYFINVLLEQVLGSVQIPAEYGPGIHNPVMGKRFTVPVICGGLTGEWQHVTHCIDGGGNLIKLEPITSTDANRWSHEFYDDVGNLITTNVQEDSRLEQIDLFTGASTVIADQTLWSTRFGAGYYQNQHGDVTLDGTRAVGSLEKTGQNLTAIMRYDYGTGWTMTALTEFRNYYGKNGSTNFEATTRPTISGDGTRVAWHGYDGAQITTFVTESV